MRANCATYRDALVEALARLLAHGLRQPRAVPDLPPPDAQRGGGPVRAGADAVVDALGDGPDRVLHHGRGQRGLVRVRVFSVLGLERGREERGLEGLGERADGLVAGARAQALHGDVL